MVYVDIEYKIMIESSAKNRVEYVAVVLSIATDDAVPVVERGWARFLDRRGWNFDQEVIRVVYPRNRKIVRHRGPMGWLPCKY